MERLRVGVLGATGAVGQRLVQMLEDHPWFSLTALVASSLSSHRPYGQAISWRLETALPREAAGMVVGELTPDLDCDFVISALDSAATGPAEDEFARAGYPVISNASNHRMDADVPLLLPEIKSGHLAVLPHQRANRHLARVSSAQPIRSRIGGIGYPLVPC